MSKFGELIDAEVPLLLDFYTDWNESCLAMSSILNKVAAALGDKAKEAELRNEGTKSPLFLY